MWLLPFRTETVFIILLLQETQCYEVQRALFYQRFSYTYQFGNFIIFFYLRIVNCQFYQFFFLFTYCVYMCIFTYTHVHVIHVSMYVCRQYVMCTMLAWKLCHLLCSVCIFCLFLSCVFFFFFFFFFCFFFFFIRPLYVAWEVVR